MSNQDKRPWLVKCQVCGAGTNEACVDARFRADEIEVPHNKRYLAARIDPYAEQPRAAAP